MTIRKGDTVRFVGRDNINLRNGVPYEVIEASKSHVKVKFAYRGQWIGTNWLLIGNFELMHSIYEEESFHIIRSRNRQGNTVCTLVRIGGVRPAGNFNPHYATKEAAEQVYTDAGYTVLGWKLVTLPFKIGA